MVIIDSKDADQRFRAGLFACRVPMEAVVAGNFMAWKQSKALGAADFAGR